MRIVFLMALLTVVSHTIVNGQVKVRPAFAPDHILVHFKSGYLNESVLTGTGRSKLSEQSLFTRRSMQDSAAKIGIGNFRKVVRKSTPDRKFTLSRNGTPVTEPDFYNLMYVDVPAGTDIRKLCKKIGAWEGVSYAEPDYYFYDDTLNPNDQYFNLQNGLEQFNDVDIDVKRAWDFTTGSSNVRVAIIDSGIDYDNPDLGNGAYRVPGAKVIDGYDYDANSNNGDDVSAWRNSHGTASAGIVGAYTNNSIGVSGIAGGNGAGNPGVSLVALRVELTTIVGDFARPAGQCIEAIYDASLSIANGGFGCHVINFSGGGYDDHWYDDPLNNAINGYRKALTFAASNGVVFVASKGNDNRSDKHYPSDYADDLVISVGASNASDLKASFSNYGNNMDVVAPGDGLLVYTTMRVGDPNGTYSFFQGTSASAPVVSGIAALLKSVNINLHRDDVENIIQLSADKVRPDVYTYTNGYNNLMGHGRVNAGRALELIHAPYVLQQHTATGGTSANITHGTSEWFSFLNDAGNLGLSEGAYRGKIYQVTKTVTIPQSLCNERYFWPRTSGATRGFSAGNPNTNQGYCHVISQTGNQVTLRTYVYYIEINSLGQSINNWYPCAPQDVIFAYTTLTKEPLATSITGSDVVCSGGGSYALTDAPAGSIVSWQVVQENQPTVPSTLFSVTSGTGNVANLQPVASAQGGALLKYSIQAGCGTQVVTRNIWVGKPFIDGTYNGQLLAFTPYPPPDDDVIVINYNPVCNSVTALTNMSLRGASSGSWQRMAANPTNLSWSSTGMNISFYFWAVGQTSKFRFTTGNACGTSANDYYFQSISCDGGDPCNQYSIAPNPVNGTMSIVVPNIPPPCETATAARSQANTGLAIETVEIKGMDGRVRRSVNAGQNKDRVSIDVSDFPEGIYFVRISSGSYSETHRVLVSK